MTAMLKNMFLQILLSYFFSCSAQVKAVQVAIKSGKAQ